MKTRKSYFVAVAAITLCGCRLCSDSCDYSPPVLEAPYAAYHGRVGSAFGNSTPIQPTPTTDGMLQPPAVTPANPPPPQTP